MGYDPMLKAFIVCVIAGLGNVMGALYASFLLGILESTVQFSLGVRYAFPMLLLLVIVALIWRPYGLFGRRIVSRQ
jgi:branched-subunit amino acid ABC-type transport system permease component